MTRRQIVRFEMLRRVRDFGAVHAAKLADTSVGGQAFATVRTIVDDLGDQAKVKMATIGEGLRAKKQARQVLALQLGEIARTAKIIALTVPRFDDGFRLPARRSDQVLITAGRLFTEAAEPVAAQFIAHGMPEAFVTTLRAQVQHFEESIAVCEEGNRDQAAAQATIAAALAAGKDAVTRLDIVVANHFKGDVATLAQWRRDRVQRSAYRQHSEPPADQPTPAPVPGPEVPPSGSVAAREAERDDRGAGARGQMKQVA
jgi:hypothetical protein